MDLSVRPWAVTGVGVIIGVFEAGKDSASWLLCGNVPAGSWSRCDDGFVSDVMTSLPAVLALIEADRRAVWTELTSAQSDATNSPCRGCDLPGDRCRGHAPLQRNAVAAQHAVERDARNAQRVGGRK